MEAENQRALDKLATDHNNKQKQDEKKYSELQLSYDQQQKDGYENVSRIERQNIAELQRITEVNTRQIQACIREEKALSVELDVIKK